MDPAVSSLQPRASSPRTGPAECAERLNPPPLPKAGSRACWSLNQKHQKHQNLQNHEFHSLRAFRRRFSPSVEKTCFLSLSHVFYNIFGS